MHQMHPLKCKLFIDRVLSRYQSFGDRNLSIFLLSPQVNSSLFGLQTYIKHLKSLGTLKSIGQW